MIIFFIQANTVYPGSINPAIRNRDEEVFAVVKGAVEDTGWIFAGSPGEMERHLSNYYTGDLLSELSKAAWDFKSLPTDWDYEIEAADILVLQLTQERAAVRVYFIEKEIFSGMTFVNIIDYYLVITEKGWRINSCEIPSGPF